MEKETLIWLQKWFEKRCPAIEKNPEKLRKVEYFKDGYIDSMDAICLVTDIEKEFGVSFTQESYQDRRFVVVGGLAQIIEELRGTK